MSGWCPRCDAVREADATCPECEAPLVALDERPPAHVVAERREEASEVGGEVEQPPKGRLRVALAVAALVLVGIAFVAGRSTGGNAGPAAAAATTTTATTAPPVAELQRNLGWKSSPAGGIALEAVSVSRGPVDTGGGPGGGDNSGLLTLRVTGLEPGRRLLAVSGLRLVDAGGGVFAQPDTIQIGGGQAVPVQPGTQADRYFVFLGPTPAVDSLDSIEVGDLLLSAASNGQSRVVLATPGAWPARPPARAVEPSSDGVAVPVTRADGASSNVPLRVAGAFVGAGRAVVVLSIPEGPGGPDESLGDFPVTATLRAGGHLLCSRIQSLGPQSSRISPLLVVDCPAKPAASLTLDLAAGFQSVQLDNRLRA